MKGAVVHQFTTVGTAAAVAMGTAVRQDVLPYCALDAGMLLLDREALERLGVAAAGAGELEAFYGRHFASSSAHYCQSVEEMLPRDAAQDEWYVTELRRFFAIRAGMQQRRMLARFCSADEALAAG